MREITMTESPGSGDPEWHIEDADCDGEGGVSTVIFIGKYAEQRAKRYYERLKSNTD